MQKGPVRPVRWRRDDWDEVEVGKWRWAITFEGGGSPSNSTPFRRNIFRASEGEWERRKKIEEEEEEELQEHHYYVILTLLLIIVFLDDKIELLHEKNWHFRD